MSMREFLKLIAYRIVYPLMDVALAPILLLVVWPLRFIRRTGLNRFKIARGIFCFAGVMPVADHYYEPLINPAHLDASLPPERSLPGIEFTVEKQLALLEEFAYTDELIQIPREKVDSETFFYHNPAFGPGDAEYLYSMIRHYKPKRIIEVGSGYSTLMASLAISRNKREDERYSCDHVCIEPYEMAWLERVGVRVIRERVEKVGIDLFSSLGEGDILFIDSSHVIRPQGDVLFEYLEVLPRLASGVLIHVHDIFTPRDYLDSWIKENIWLWNEQYLLEAFLSLNGQFEIIGALNYLKHNHFILLAEKCPILKSEPEREPGSFWLRKK